MRLIKATHSLGPRALYPRGRVNWPSRVVRSYCASCESPAPATTSSPKKPVSHQSSSSSIPTPTADHRQLAIEQDLFTTSIYSPGSPLFLPNGARVFNKLVSFMRAQYAQFGFEEVLTPTIYKKSLWEKSGHWENYADDMFAVSQRKAQPVNNELEAGEGEGEDYGLKPMNCPGHCLLFAAQRRSFRDLPVRYADFSPLHRNEISGALSGLTRVRRFHQDDAHIFCRPAQIGEEISKTLDFVKLTYETFRLGSYKLVLSTRPEDHYIGQIEDWNRAEDALRESLSKSGKEWSINPGDGAFYGPKIDIILKDSDGKEHQTATIQLDFQLPKRFGLEYQAPAPELEQKGLTTDDAEQLATYGNVTPVIVHRAIFGSVERFFALLVEHYNGRWPFWLSPRQVAVLTVTDDESVLDYASRTAKVLRCGERRELFDCRNDQSASATVSATNPSQQASSASPSARALSEPTLSVDVDTTPRSLKRKIAEAKAMRYNIIVVVGKRDIAQSAADGTVVTDTLNADFSATPDPDGLLARLIAEESGKSTDSVDLKSVQLTAPSLRRILCRWEGAFQ